MNLTELKNKPVNDAKAHEFGKGDEKGGVGKALTGDTAKPMGSFGTHFGH